MNKIKKLLVRLGIIGAIALEASILSGLTSKKEIPEPNVKYAPHEIIEPEQSQISGKTIVIQRDNLGSDDVPCGPVYTAAEVPPTYCARYVRLAARDLFGLNYPTSDAWRIRDAPNVDEIRLDDGIRLDNLVSEGKLKRGMIVGAYNPTSKYNGREDVKKAGYTHNLLYLGKSEDGKLYFADHFGKTTRPRISLEELRAKNKLVPIEVLYLKSKKQCATTH
ncbi:MAG: hypothetical protein AABY16_04130 [Nanoarchaeota archaeon]